MAELESETTALRLAREILASERPAELPLFDAQAGDLLDDIRRGERTSRSNDQFLGIGGDGIVALLTPVAVAMSWAAVTFLAEVARSVAKDMLKERLTAWLAAGGPGAPPKLPPELAEELRAALLAEFRHRFPGTEPGDLVDRVVARIAPEAAGHDAAH